MREEEEEEHQEDGEEATKKVLSEATIALLSSLRHFIAFPFPSYSHSLPKIYTLDGIVE